VFLCCREEAVQRSKVLRVELVMGCVAHRSAL
jgi:hypothetical protein